MTGEGLQALAEQGRAQVGKTHGDGFEIEHCQHGRGFSYRLYGRKDLNGFVIRNKVYVPGPFDAIAGYTRGLEEKHMDWIGWERERRTFGMISNRPRRLPLNRPVQPGGNRELTTDRSAGSRSSRATRKPKRGLQCNRARQKK